MKTVQNRNDAEVALAADASVRADWGILRWKSLPRYRPQQPEIVKLTENPMLDTVQDDVGSSRRQ